MYLIHIHRLMVTIPLDHVLTTLNLCNAVSKYESYFIHNNFSDHIPLYIKLDINISYCPIIENSIPVKTSWRRCTANDVECYKSYFDHELCKIEYDHNVMGCQDVKCKIHTDHLNYVYDNIIVIAFEWDFCSPFYSHYQCHDRKFMIDYSHDYCS